MSYKATYDAAKLNPEKFWMEAAEKVDWITSPSKALFDDNAPFYEWFSDAEVNTCFNAVDRHVIAGNGKQTAIICILLIWMEQEMVFQKIVKLFNRLLSNQI